MGRLVSGVKFLIVKIKNKTGFVLKLLIELENRKYVFHPTKKVRLIWDWIHLILIICYLYILPVNISFDMNLIAFYKNNLEKYGEVFLVFEQFSLFFFIVDFIINLNTAYYDKVNSL